MLIHLGGQEFVDLHYCVAIVNLQTVDPATRRRALAARPAAGSEARSAVLTTGGRWLTSTISPEALAHRGRTSPFPGALYLRPPAGRGSPAPHPVPHEE